MEDGFEPKSKPSDLPYLETNTILTGAIGLSIKEANIDQRPSRRLGKVMRAIGYEYKKNVRKAGGLQSGAWVRPQD